MEAYRYYSLFVIVLHDNVFRMAPLPDACVSAE